MTTTTSIAQRQEQTYLIFFSPYSNTYRVKNYRKYGSVLHISRSASILKSTVKSACGLISALYTNFQDNQWLIVEKSEFRSPDIAKHLCRRCLTQVESVIPAEA